MSDNVLLDKTITPDETLVEKSIGSCYKYFKEIHEITQELVGETRNEWKHYGKKMGWSYKTFYKKRNLFFMTICDNFFRIIFVFGEKAFNKIIASDIAEELKQELSDAKKYAEGRGLRIEVKDETYLSDIKKLIEIKLNN